MRACVWLKVCIYSGLALKLQNCQFHQFSLFEPRCKKNVFFAYAITAKLISAFVFATLITQSFYYLNSKFQASSYLLWLYSPVCV